MSNPLLEKLREQRASLKTTVDGIVENVATEERSELTETEERNFSEANEAIKKLDARIEELSDIELRNAKAVELAAKVDAGVETRNNAPVRVTKNEDVYREDEMEKRSFFRDIANYNRDPGATDRLNRHYRNTEETMETRDLAMGDFAGFVPPAYLVSKFAELARGGRPVADIIPSQGAPQTNLFYIPRITSGTTVAFQSSENSDLGEGTMAVSNITVATRTLGGYVDVSQQSLDLGQLPDNLITKDLAEVYALKVEDMVLNSSTSNNEGITEVSGTNTVTYTDATPTAGELFGTLGYAESLIVNNRHARPSVIIADGTTYSWLKSRVDANQRPLVTAYDPQNAIARFGASGAEGVMGELFGYPLVMTTSALLAQDATPSNHQVVLMRHLDSMLWEGAPRFNRYDEIGSATATVRFRVYNYVAQTHARQPSGISVIQGSGLGLSASSF